MGLDSPRHDAAITLIAEHAVDFSVGGGGHGLYGSPRQGVQFLFADAVNSPAAANPEKALLVFEDLEDAIIKKAVGGGVAGELAVFVAQHATVVGTNP